VEVNGGNGHVLGHAAVAAHTECLHEGCRVAEVVAARAALRARPADVAVGVDDHAHTLRPPGDVRADRGYLCGELVTHDHGRAEDIEVGGVKVGPADPAELRAEQDGSGPGLGYRVLLELDLTVPVQRHCLHVIAP
jgi:hypothetical protein